MAMLHLYKKEKPSHQLTISIVDSGLGMENPARGGDYGDQWQVINGERVKEKA